MTTLTEFLLARIAEDEAAARDALDKPTTYGGAHGDTPFDEVVEMGVGESASKYGAYHIDRHDPTRVLAECQAKRRIVEDYDAADESWRNRPAPENPKRLGKWYHDMTPEDFERYEAWAAAVSLRDAVEQLAMVYANHPDYDEAWRA